MSQAFAPPPQWLPGLTKKDDANFTLTLNEIEDLIMRKVLPGVDTRNLLTSVKEIWK